MTNAISFGNNIGYKIVDFNTKKKLLDYLFKTVDIYKLNLKRIEDEKDLLNIKNSSYYIYPNIIGKDYIFLKKKIKNIYYAVLIDKDNLNNNVNINYNSVTIIGLKIRMSLKSYKGTILEGRLVNLGGRSVFIINDDYQLYGKDIETFDINKSQLSEFINNSVIIDHHMNIIDFKINKIYDISSIDHVVNEKIKNSRHNITSIVFIPNNDNVKYTYNICDVSEQNIKKYFLAKYDKTDVVSLYALDENGCKKKVGIAHIPTIKCSHICSRYVPQNDYIKVLCKLNTNFKKWQPIEIINDETDGINRYDDAISCIKNIISMKG